MYSQQIQFLRKKVFSSYNHWQRVMLALLLTFFAFITSGLFYAFVPAQDQSGQRKQARPISGTAIISGTVTLKGKPVRGVWINLTYIIPETIKTITEFNSQFLRDTRHMIYTDENGQFLISEVRAGRYCIRAYAESFISPGINSCQPLNVTDGEKIDNIALELVRGGVVTGRITDSQGNPVTGEFVTAAVDEDSVDDKSKEFSKYSIGHQVLTDDRGEYRIYDLSPGRYKIKSGFSLTYAPPSIEIVEGSEITGINMTLADAEFKGHKISGIPSGEITVHFVTEEGKVLPNIRASMFPVTENSDSNRNNIVIRRGGPNITDENGNLKISDYEEKSKPTVYQALHIAYANGYVPKYPAYQRIGNNISVTMIKGGVITGKVRNVNGEPVAGAIIKLDMIRDVDGKPQKRSFDIFGKSDDRGIYRCWGMPPGTYLVYVDSRLDGPFAENFKTNNRIYYSSSRTKEQSSEITVKSGTEINGIDIQARKN